MALVRKSLNKYGEFYRQLKDSGATFSVIETSYTKRIKKGKNTIIFADSPINPIELKLMNLIRSSADTFEVPTMEENAPQIAFYKFFDYHEQKKFNGVKIDLNEAYWQTAINIGLVTPEIQFYFVDNKDRLGNDKAVKMARLRSLGALATKRTIKYVEDGILMDETLEVNEPHRQLYLYICEQVAEVMHDLACEFMDKVIYYYWDCIFLDASVDVDEVNKRIVDMGYRAKLEGQGEYEVIKGNHISYLHDLSKDVKYPIKNSDLIT